MAASRAFTPPGQQYERGYFTLTHTSLLHKTTGPPIGNFSFQIQIFPGEKLEGGYTFRFLLKIGSGILSLGASYFNGDLI